MSISQIRYRNGLGGLCQITRSWRIAIAVGRFASRLPEVQMMKMRAAFVMSYGLASISIAVSFRPGARALTRTFPGSPVDCTMAKPRP